MIKKLTSILSQWLQIEKYPLSFYQNPIDFTFGVKNLPFVTTEVEAFVKNFPLDIFKVKVHKKSSFCKGTTVPTEYF